MILSKIVEAHAENRLICVLRSGLLPKGTEKMERNDRENNVEPIFGGALGNDNLLVCTPSGRVIFMAGGLKLLVGEDYTGRNLNDFVADPVVAQIIIQTQQGKLYEFDCTVASHRFRCSAELCADNIYIYFYSAEAISPGFMDLTSAQFVSRELHSTLAVLLAAVDSVKAQLKSTPQGSETVAILTKNLYKLLRLSHNMLDCAMAENGSLSLRLSEADLTDVCRVLAQELQPLCGESGIGFTCQLPEQPVICRVDVDKVRRLLLNLMANAMAACRDGGSISLLLSQREQNVVLTVSDTGSGIAGEILSGIFEKHKRLSPEQGGSIGGAGFGMALVKAFAEQHNGSFVVTSVEGRGTAACVTLPKNEGAEVSVLGSLQPAYTVGMQDLLVELSPVLDKRFFEKI